MLKPYIEWVGDGKVAVYATCRRCHKEFRKELDNDKVQQVLEGKHVQDVFPEMPPADRELFFISGTCGACWDEIFKGKDK